MKTTASTVLTLSAGGGCCAPSAPAPQVPALISNSPGLSSIRYRIGTFGSFRQTMLGSMALPDLMATSVTTLTSAIGPEDPTIAVLDFSQFPTIPNFRIKIGSEYLQVVDGAGTSTWRVIRGSSATAHSVGDAILLSSPNPFASWHPGTDGDYQTMFVELWAYLADILTFYQERIANEAYLGTASLRDSLLRLVGLIDYHPKPGAGASGLVAFTAAKGSSLIVPDGFRVGSKPLPGRPAVVFETLAAVTASGDNSAIRLSTLSPDVPFPQNTLILQGINNRLAVDDYVLAVENQGTAAEAAHLLQLSDVRVEKSTDTTAVVWQQEIGGGPYVQASKQVSVFALRVMAAPFGADAPPWNTLSATLTNSDQQHSGAPYPNNWDSPTLEETLFDRIRELRMAVSKINLGGVFDTPSEVLSGGAGGVSLSANQWFRVPAPGDGLKVLYLDNVYKQLNYTQEKPGWAVLLTDGVFQILHVTDARPSVKVAYTLSSKVTRLTFLEDVFTTLDIPVFPLRNTIVLTGGELLTLKTDLPLAEEVSEKELVLLGTQAQLQSGQTIVIKGNLFDATTGLATGTPAAESNVIDGPPRVDPVNNVTVVNLKNSLANQYARSTCTVLANVVEVTQGETVKDEVLGSSDGTVFQSYALKKKPLTYLPSTDPEGLAAVKSTLRVIVNGVAWNEQPNLVESTPDAQDFTTTLDDTGQTTVVFGDGLNGARPPRGVNNIHAQYRKGLGSSGNLSSDAIQQLIDSVPNLQKVTNPLATSGGDDPDSPGQIRVAAPASLRTFSRAVSAADYAALALNFPGISKATACWILRDPATLLSIAHPYVQLTVATADRTPIQGALLARNLRRFLDNHRDPNVLLRLQDYSPVYIEVTVQVEVDGRFPRHATLSQVQAALNPGENPDGTAGYFAFDRLQFGQTIFLSELYAVVQSIAGVKDATITSLRRVGPGTAEAPGPPHDIAVGATEIGVIGPPGAGQGQLTVNGLGGFGGT